jgi:excisionase family DNA binding protein
MSAKTPIHKNSDMERHSTTMQGTSPYLTRPEAAAYLQVNADTISRYVRDGVGGVKLKTVTVGGQKRYTRELLDQFVSSRTDT